MYNNTSQYCFVSVFLIKQAKPRLDEHKRLLSKTFKIVIFQIFVLFKDKYTTFKVKWCITKKVRIIFV